MKRDEHNSDPLDAILRRASTLPPGIETPECADPEMLAAYYDRSLDTSERERLDAHFADCARCQMQLAAIARADHRAGNARPAFGIAWLRKWQVAIPAFAAVAAVVVFIAVMRRGNDESRRDLQIAMAKREAPQMDLAARAPAPASAPSAAQVASTPEPATNELAMNDSKRAQPAAILHREESPREYRTKRVDRPSTTASNQMGESSATKSSEIGGMASAPMTNSSSSTASGRAAAGGSSAIGGAVGAPETLVMISPPERPTMSAQTAGAPSSVENGRAASAGSAIAGAAIGAMVASNSVRQRGPTWMAGKQGTILFRDADGRTRSQHSGVETDLTAGAAPSATVCWIVGRSGTIIRTTDGEDWTKIASPTDADLTAVTANSAERAVVTTAAGQNFATTDGGVSWHLQ